MIRDEAVVSEQEACAGAGRGALRQVVAACFAAVAADHGVVLTPLEEETELADCGLDSLAFAVVLARLEDETGLDPFADAAEEGFAFPTTFGDLVRRYEQARDLAAC